VRHFRRPLRTSTNHSSSPSSSAVQCERRTRAFIGAPCLYLFCNATFPARSALLFLPSNPARSSSRFFSAGEFFCSVKFSQPASWKMIFFLFFFFVLGECPLSPADAFVIDPLFRRNVLYYCLMATPFPKNSFPFLPLKKFSPFLSLRHLMPAASLPWKRELHPPFLKIERIRGGAPFFG